MVGKIYLAKIYFTDLSEYKIRPVIVIKEYGEDCICLPLTSNLEHHGILLAQEDMSDGSLKKESMVVFPKNFTLHKSILFKHIATVTSKKYTTVFTAFCEQMGCIDK